MKIFLLVLLIVATFVTAVSKTELTITAMDWASYSTTNVDNPNLSLLSISLYLFSTNWGVNIEGTDLWQVGLFGSENDQGTGVRYANVEQNLDQRFSSSALRRGFPFHVEFSILFNITEVGCGDVRYLCLEMKRNPETSTPFVLKRETGEKTIISCREVPCSPLGCYQRCPPPRVNEGPVCGTNGKQYSSLCEFINVLRCEGVRADLDSFDKCLPEPNFEFNHVLMRLQQRTYMWRQLA